METARAPISVALETNGRGYLGFLVDLPGAYVRGAERKEALAKVAREVESYRRWCGEEPVTSCTPAVVQVFESKAVIEDADTEILLDADRAPMTEADLARLLDLAGCSGQTIERLYAAAALKDWVDRARIRPTFYGRNPTTIREILRHVRVTHDYYLSRLGLPPAGRGCGFVRAREACLASLRAIAAAQEAGEIREVQGELWTLRKVLRRFIWHDRLHAKAMTRILTKQKSLGQIGEFDDPFCFLAL